MRLRGLLVAGVLCATLLPIAACSDDSNTATPNPTAEQTSPGASGPPPGPEDPGGGTGTSTDKNACVAITNHLSAWGAAFAEAAGGLATAGSDSAKIEAVVTKVKQANTKFAADLRVEAGKTTDAEVKKVANDLAGALEKINTQLTASGVQANPDTLTAIFDTPEYAASAEGYEKLCGAA